MKKIVERKCLASGKLYPMDNLLRVVKSKDGLIKFDPTGKAPGRGAYILKSLEALEIARKKKVFEKAFKCSIEPALYDQLLESINTKGNNLCKKKK